ncbi:MAG: cadherin-like domain-containing protein [Acidimicrobiia bacterium]|nr:cadherin-like domain-containing protein [Acidimicrobiia bacterium]NNL28088.1 cadherin-like domain-containing protein [Acidimicrobiia bacterium]
MRILRTSVTLLLAMLLLMAPAAGAHHTPFENPADTVAAVDDVDCTFTGGESSRDFVTEVDGERAFGIFAAPETTPTALVVIGHGAWHSAESWRDHIIGLTGEYNTLTVAMEYRGLERINGHLGDDPAHPEANNWPEKKGGEDLIAAAKLFKAECGIDTVILAGVSMGVSISGYAVSHLDPADQGLFDYWVTSEGVHSMLETYQAASAAGSEAADWIEAETGCAYDPVTCHEPYAERTNIMQTAAIEAAGLKRVVYLHAVADGLVPYNQSRQMSGALQVPFEFYTLTSAGEGSDGTSWTDYLSEGDGPLAGHASERDPDSLLTRATFERIGAIATGDLADCGEYHVEEGAMFPDVEFRALATYNCGSGPEGLPPAAADDHAATTDRIGVDIDVLANDEDLDTDREQLTITGFSQPEAGVVTRNDDDTLHYEPVRGAIGSFSFQYTINDPEGNTASATVTVDVTKGNSGGGQGDDGDKVTGGGYLEPTEGKKINFGFNAKSNADGTYEGHLTFNDKDAGVKVRLDSVSSLGDVAGECGGAVGANSAEFAGSGTFNGDLASFRVCVADAGEPGNSGPGGADLFYLECLDGCTYSTGDRTADNVIDGGNIQVRRAVSEPVASESQSATVLILGPMLMTETSARAEIFTVTAYGNDGQPATGVDLTLESIQADGTTLLRQAVTDATGLAVFSVATITGDVEHVVRIGDLTSNAVHITGLL